MTPLTVNPTTVILLNPVTRKAELVATNVAGNMTVKVVNTISEFDNEAANKPFCYNPAEVRPEPQYEPAN